MLHENIIHKRVTKTNQIEELGSLILVVQDQGLKKNRIHHYNLKVGLYSTLKFDCFDFSQQLIFIHPKCKDKSEKLSKQFSKLVRFLEDENIKFFKKTEKKVLG